MKRVLSVVLAILMVVSAFAVSGAVSAQQLDTTLTATADEATKDEATKDEATKDEATKDEEIEEEVDLDLLPKKPDGYNRYFFYMPEKWKENNPYTKTAGVYWWEGTDACECWPGYEANPTGFDGVYYYDVPKDVTTIIWNNFFDENVDYEISNGFGRQTKNINTEYYDMGENELYPDGVVNFDGMIYVVDLNKTEVNEYSGKSTFKGEWFYYYGNGEYGLAEVKEEADVVLKGDTVDTSALSPDTDPEDTQKPETRRYFFYMPEKWKENNPYTKTAGIYWWNGTDACKSWPGYEAKKTAIEDIYYYDVPKDVTTIIWSNFVDGGSDNTQDIYTLAYQTVNIGSEYYEAYESELYPDGVVSFDGMIYVIDYDLTDVNEYSGKSVFKGEWFYYYGNGEYGTAENKKDAKFVLTEDNVNISKLLGEEDTTTESTTSPEDDTHYDLYRYYFYVPESWVEKDSDSLKVGIYWWDGSNACDSWPGYEAKKADAEGVYYYDVPSDVVSIIWNNMQDNADTSGNSFYTVNIGTEYYESDESLLYPEGTDNFNNMIYVVDPDNKRTNLYGNTVFGGEWYYYYGNGEYGLTENKGNAFVVYNTDTIDTEKVYKENFTNGVLNTVPTEPATDPAETVTTPSSVVTDPQETTKATVPAESETTTEATEPSETTIVTDPTEVSSTPSTVATEPTESSVVTEPAEVTTESLPAPTEPTETTTVTKATEPATETTVLTETTETTEATEISTEATVPTQTTEATEVSTENSTETTETTGSAGELVSYLMGDADLNGKVNVKDATLIQKHAAKLTFLEGDSAVTADVNGDGKINVKDATVIQKFVAKIEIDFVVGEIVKKEVLF